MAIVCTMFFVRGRAVLAVRSVTDPKNASPRMWCWRQVVRGRQPIENHDDWIVACCPHVEALAGWHHGRRYLFAQQGAVNRGNERHEAKAE